MFITMSVYNINNWAIIKKTKIVLLNVVLICFNCLAGFSVWY